MEALATIGRWMLGVTLAVALAFAPVVPAFADCGSGKSHPDKMQMSGMTAKPAKMPCDMPCNDCAPAPTKKGCGDCVCVTMVLATPPAAPLWRIDLGAVEPHDIVPLLSLARPPDTPPPRSLA